MRKLGASFAIFALVLGMMACTKAKPQPQQSSPILATESVVKIETALGADDKQARATVISPELRQQYLTASEQGFSAGTTVQIDRRTFVATGDYGRIEAEVSGRGHYFFYLLRSENEWRIFHMENTALQSSTVALRPVADVKRIVAQEECATGFGRKVPVLFVHGLNSSKGMWLETKGTIYDPVAALPDVLADAFDYKNYHSL